MFGAANRHVLDRETVGVVADSHPGVRPAPEATVYEPCTHWN